MQQLGGTKDERRAQRVSEPPQVVRIVGHDGCGQPHRRVRHVLGRIQGGQMHLDACALAVIQSGKVVPSNHWRALEVVRAVETRELPESADLREAYEQMRRGGPQW